MSSLLGHVFSARGLQAQYRVAVVPIRLLKRGAIGACRNHCNPHDPSDVPADLRFIVGLRKQSGSGKLHVVQQSTWFLMLKTED
jgi:hypothetical protein